MLPPRMSRGTKISLLVLLCGAIAGNHLKLPLYFKMDLFFGSIFTMLIIQLFGFRWGVLAALGSSTYSWLMWNHHFSGINFVCEAVFVGFLLKRKNLSLVTLSTTYWIVLGMPLAWLYFTFFVHLNTDAALPVMLKQGINGIFNALVATLIVTFLPFLGKFQVDTENRKVNFQQIISIALAACVLFPMLSITILGIREDFRNEMQIELAENLDHVADQSQMALQGWVKERVAVISVLAHFENYAVIISDLQKNIEQINKADDNFQQFALFDSSGTSIAFDPHRDPLTGKTNIGEKIVDNAHLQEIKAARKPIISDIMTAKVGTASPRLVVEAPIVTKDRFKGYVMGVLELNALNGALERISKDWSCKVSILDGKRMIIASSDPTLKPMESFAMKGGEFIPVGSSTYRWIPSLKKGIPTSERWRQSFLLKELPVSDDMSWRLVVGLPLEPKVQYLNKLFTKNLLAMLLLLLFTIVFSHLVGKRLALSIGRLREVSAGLPDRLSQHDSVQWPTSHIAEVHSLIGNFKSVAGSLSAKFSELGVANSELNRENRERKAAEEQLSRATLELKAIFEAFPDLCFVVNEKLNIMDCKGGKARDVILNQGDLLGQSMMDIYPPDVAVLYHDAIHKVFDSGSKEAFEYNLKFLDSDTFFEARLAPLFHDRVIIIVRNITALRKAEALKASNEQLRSLSVRLEAAREQERMLIAREIHDELGQQLTALRFDLGWMNKKLPDNLTMLVERTSSMSQLVDSTIKTVQRIAMELRPRLLDDLGLVAAMEWQVHEFQARTGISCNLAIEPSEIVVDPGRSTSVFRVFQEALTNIIRHAHATRVDVTLRENGAALQLDIVDNGKGITQSQLTANSSLGIMGMHERVRQWGGDVVISGRAGKGTVVGVTIPLGGEEVSHV